MKKILINCDLGEMEGFSDLDLLPYIDIANIACGGHAGSVELARKLAIECEKRRIKMCCHIGYEDRENFGRLEYNWSASKIISQMDIQRIVLPKCDGLKFHGALYNRLGEDISLAKALMHWAKKVGIRWVLAPDESAQAKEALAVGIKVLREVFAERSYRRSNGHLGLQPRSRDGAVLEDLKEALEQGRALLSEQLIPVWQEEKKVFYYEKIQADTICVHSDSKIALSLLQKLKEGKNVG